MLTSIPHFDQWLGVWAIREEDFHAGYQWFMGLDLHVHLQTAPSQAARQASDEMRADIRGGVEVIGLYGSLMKQQASMSRSTSTVLARKRVRAAGKNSDVQAVLLHIESPGGTAAGTKELADDIAALAKEKPVYAFIEDLGASAAYWIASQATKVYANPTAIVGSIGTYGVVYDYSAMAAKDGIKVHVIRAGAMKGAFTPGTEVSAEHLTEQQKLVNDLNEFFIRGVSAGRRLSLTQARELADGRVYVGQAAFDRNLIDGVQSLDDTFSQLAALGSKTQSAKRSKNMQVTTSAEANSLASAITPETNQQVATGGNSATPSTQASGASAAPAARPATLSELKAACPGAGNDFLVSQLDANATAAQATTAFLNQLAAEKLALTKENESLKAKGSNAAQAGGGKQGGADKPGLSAEVSAQLSAAGGKNDQGGGDAVEAFNDAVAEEMKRSNSPKHRAHQAVCRKQPELRQAMIAAHSVQFAPKRR